MNESQEGSRFDPSVYPAALVNATRMLMNHVVLKPPGSLRIPLMVGTTGFVAYPTIPTVPRLAKRILREVTMCSFCWEPGDLEHGPDGLSWSIVHVIPLYVGGKENLSNLVKSCQTCRRRRGLNIAAPHPETPWAAADPDIGDDLWLNYADEIYRGNLVVQPYVAEFASEAERVAQITKWRSIQPVKP